MKPILIIWVPTKAVGMFRNNIGEMLELFQDYAEKKSDGNHSVLTLPKIGSDQFAVSVYNAENIDPLEIQKLRLELHDFFNKTKEPPRSAQGS